MLLRKTAVFALVITTIAAILGCVYFAREAHLSRTELARQTAPEPKRNDPLSPSPSINALIGLPYIEARKTDQPLLRGVVMSDPDAGEGLNFYTSGTSGQNNAFLIGMDGKTVHRWTLPTVEISGRNRRWIHSELLPDGDVITGLENERLLRINDRSKLQWNIPLPVHHDFWVKPDGDIYALTHRRQLIPGIHPAIPCLVDHVTIVSPDGKVRSELSILDSIRRSPYRFLLASMRKRTLDSSADEIDLLHTNHIELANGAGAARSKILAAGNILLSMRNLNAIMILDGTTHDILWMWGPTNITAQHHPSFLPNGNILVFNNGPNESTGKYESEVVEIDPITYQTMWSYAPGPSFYSASRGGAQRLPNGDTLITDSDKGTVLQVTPSGEIVWVFMNPDVNEKGMRVAIWRMKRFDRSELKFLPAAEPAGQIRAAGSGTATPPQAAAVKQE